MSTPEQLVAQGGQQLERRLEKGMQRRLVFHPRLRVGEGLEDATSSADGSVHETPVYQEQEDDRSLMKRRRRPIRGVGQIVLQVQPGVPDRFFKQRETVLVIAVQAVMCEFTYPTAWQLTDE